MFHLDVCDPVLDSENQVNHARRTDRVHAVNRIRAGLDLIFQLEGHALDGLSHRAQVWSIRHFEAGYKRAVVLRTHAHLTAANTITAHTSTKIS